MDPEKARIEHNWKKNGKEGYWYNRVTGADVEESHRAGWSGVNDTQCAFSTSQSLRSN